MKRNAADIKRLASGQYAWWASSGMWSRRIQAHHDGPTCCGTQNRAIPTPVGDREILEAAVQAYSPAGGRRSKTKEVFRALRKTKGKLARQSPSCRLNRQHGRFPGVHYCPRRSGLSLRLKILLRLEQLSKLLEQLAVAREVAGRIFPLHLTEQHARTLQHFVAGTYTGRAGYGGCRR